MGTSFVENKIRKKEIIKQTVALLEVSLKPIITQQTPSAAVAIATIVHFLFAWPFILFISPGFYDNWKIIKFNCTWVAIHNELLRSKCGSGGYARSTNTAANEKVLLFQVPSSQYMNKYTHLTQGHRCVRVCPYEYGNLWICIYYLFKLTFTHAHTQAVIRLSRTDFIVVLFYVSEWNVRNSVTGVINGTQ